MAREYNSNYLGMVIDNNDPEFRGRIQVFIPHIMPTLYEGWNKEGKDITINCVGDNMPQGLTSEIVDKLKKILPWAEAASPIVGQSSPGGVFPAIAAAVTAVGEAAAGAVTAAGEAVAGALTFDQSPTTIPAGNLPPGSELKIPTEPGVTTRGLVPAFTQRLNGFYQEAMSLGYKIRCSSAFRSTDNQTRLYKGSGGYQTADGKWTGGNGSVARPGGSSHEFGIAVDLKTTGNGVSITEIKTATDRTVNRDTPAYRALLNKYGLHQPLHPEVYGSDIPEKWHVEPIEMPGFNKTRAGVAKGVAARLAGSAPSASELPSASQFPPNTSPLTTKSPTNTDLAPPTAPTTNTIPAPPPATASATPATPVISAGGEGISGTVSGGGTATQAAAGASKLAKDRIAYFEKELGDPTLLDRIEFVIKKEGGAQGQLIFETACNRAMFSNRTLKTVIYERAYFKDAAKGDPNATKTQPHTKLTLDAIKNVIYNGANVTNMGTDQAYNDKNLFAKKFIDAGCTGTWFDLKNGQPITDPARVAKLSNSPGSGMEELIYTKDGQPPNGRSKAGQTARAYAINNNIKPTTPSSFNANTPLPPELAAASTSSLTNEPLNSLPAPATVGNTDPHGPTVVKNTNDSAKGMFTFPGVGAMVWVFFREGNPLFPVYFAASYSSSEWKSAYGGNSLNPDGTNQGTVGSQVSNSLKLNPNAGGGLEFTHVKNVNDPTGSSDTAVAMIYGDDGSNMMFSKGYHQIYTRNDRRDQIDGHIYSIIGGAEEKWIEDDSSLNVKGNVTIKIGKIDAESMNAMKELSDFSKQMNDTLMSNAGTPPPPEAAAPTAPPTDAGAAQSGIDDLKADKFANSTVPPEPEKPWAANKSVGEGTGPTIQNAANLKTATASGGGTQRLTTDTPEKIAQRQQYNSPEGQQQRAEKRAKMREEYKASKG